MSCREVSRRGSGSIRHVAIAVLVFATGCYSWAAQSAPPEQAVVNAGAGPVRITRTDHSVLELAQVAVVRDSVIGTATDGSNARVAIPVAEVQRVATWEPDAARSLGLGLGVLAGVFAAFGVLVVIALSNANWD